jgi:hypothetical protein
MIRRARASFTAAFKADAALAAVKSETTRAELAQLVRASGDASMGRSKLPKLMDDLSEAWQREILSARHPGRGCTAAVDLSSSREWGQ